MHSGLHTITHRAPGGATRANVRWQPYKSLPTSVSSSTISTRSSPTTYLNTPNSVSSSSPTYSTPPTSFDGEKFKTATQPSTPLPKDAPPLKNHKYALGLVDQAVKALCEIWRPQDIPSVFLTSVPTAGSSGKGELLLSSHPTTQMLLALSRNNQLPSPLSPSTSASSPLPPPSRAVQSESTTTSCMFGARSNLVPIKGFVHEVLRRSRTSGCVLQTALCYLEAIRAKIPELAGQERSGNGSHSEPDLNSRITPATPEEIMEDALLCNDGFDNLSDMADSAVDTVKVEDLMATALIDDISPCKQSTNSDSLTPLPPLPSPLLCPRRAFLAALILASKFTQDKCYSNRAWAKLSGLPPREISRCERALGAALEWRLWVGKGPSSPQLPSLVAPATIPANKGLGRCRSESNLRTPIQTPTPFFLEEEGTASSSTRPPVGNALRRASTLPASVFSSRYGDITPAATQDSEMTMDYSVSPIMTMLSMMPGTQHLFDDNNSISDSERSQSSFMSTAFSPCPSLSYSPSSTESSEGGRTVQMSSFLDDISPVNFSAINHLGSESWLWLDASPTPQPTVKASTFATAVSGTRLGAQVVMRLSQGAFVDHGDQDKLLHPIYSNLMGTVSSTGLWNGDSSLFRSAVP